MPAMSGSQWDSAQWGECQAAPGDPEMDALDRLHSPEAFAANLGIEVAKIYKAIRAGMDCVCKQGKVTVSRRMWETFNRGV